MTARDIIRQIDSLPPGITVKAKCHPEAKIDKTVTGDVVTLYCSACQEVLAKMGQESLYMNHLDISSDGRITFKS